MDKPYALYEMCREIVYRRLREVDNTIVDVEFRYEKLDENYRPLEITIKLKMQP